MLFELTSSEDATTSNASTTKPRTFSRMMIPSKQEIAVITQNFVDDLASFTYYDASTDTFHPMICCVCDALPSGPKCCRFVPITKAVCMFRQYQMESLRLTAIYPDVLLQQYCVTRCNELKPFVLSPATYINENKEIIICNKCFSDFNTIKGKQTLGFPPEQSIANGYVIGDPPTMLSELNEVELSLVCRARTYCQSWVFYAGCHEQIKGWHTFFKSNPSDNVGNLLQLTDAGLDKMILVVLCGPFTSTQKAITLKSTSVNPHKVIDAWRWLKANNKRYELDRIPNIDDIAMPQLIHEGNIVEGTNADIKNQITTTVVFPDATLPEPTNGGFKDQDEFRKFVTNQKDGHWKSQLHVRPLATRIADYEKNTIADAFPLQFPFGFTGLAEDDDAVNTRVQNKNKTRLEKQDVITKYLTHRKPAFHSPMFNLVMENMIMKEQIFKNTKMHCNVKCSDNTTMGEKFGCMTGNQLEKAIFDVRNKFSVQHSMSPEHQYLKSIKASCGNLPHSNEATMEARRLYFCYLVKFGLPSIFLTVTPDDLRNFRIVVYSLSGIEGMGGKVDVNKLTDNQIIADFKLRSELRVKHPGLCAEEYEHIVKLVIKHLFNWDTEEQKSNGKGLFAEILAFTLATEEQGRKTLHGHFLLFVKGWKQILNVLQNGNENSMENKAARKSAKAFFANACSARLFADFENGKPLDEIPVFYHGHCRGERNLDEIRFAVVPASDQKIREMRHKMKCKDHNGHVATCNKCQKEFTVNEIVANALNVHLGKRTDLYTFPETNVRRLDRQVYEDQKHFSWTTDDIKERAIRYFSSNALVNMHYVKHTPRCFKKGPECFADLPDSASEKVSIIYHEECDYWSDWCGQIKKKYMFRFQPKRCVEDAFMNTHNPTITSLLGVNNNVMVGMNGRLVMYVTGYNAKSQQKEEKQAWEVMGGIIINIMKRPVSTTF